MEKKAKELAKKKRGEKKKKEEAEFQKRVLNDLKLDQKKNSKNEKAEEEIPNVDLSAMQAYSKAIE